MVAILGTLHDLSLWRVVLLLLSTLNLACQQMESTISNNCCDAPSSWLASLIILWTFTQTEFVSTKNIWLFQIQLMTRNLCTYLCFAF